MSKIRSMRRANYSGGLSRLHTIQNSFWQWWIIWFHPSVSATIAVRRCDTVLYRAYRLGVYACQTPVPHCSHPVSTTAIDRHASGTSKFAGYRPITPLLSHRAFFNKGKASTKLTLLSFTQRKHSKFTIDFCT